MIHMSTYPFQIMILFSFLDIHAVMQPGDSPSPHMGHQDLSMLLRFFKKISETTKSIVEDFAFVRDQYHNFEKDWRDEGFNLSLKSRVLG